MMKLIIVALLFLMAPQWANAQGLVCQKLFAPTAIALQTVAEAPRLREALNIGSELAAEGKAFNRAASLKMITGIGFRNLTVHARQSENYGSTKLKFEEALTHFFQELKPLRDRIEELKESLDAPVPRYQQRMIEAEFHTALLRIKNENSGVIARTSNFLSAEGINHTLTRNPSKSLYDEATYHIEIEAKGDHYINRMAARMQEGRTLNGVKVPGYGLKIILNPAELLEYRSEGMFFENNGDPRIILDPSILLNDSKIRNSTALHEFHHGVNSWLLKNGVTKPYHAVIRGVKISDKLRDKLGVYAEHLSVDELLAFRTSMRVMARHAIVHSKKQPELAMVMFELIREDVAKQIVFSDVIRKVFRKIELEETERAHISSLSRSKKITIEEGIFTVDTAPHLQVSKTVEMSEFTHMLYSAIATKLNLAETRSNEVKIRTIRQIARVLSLPSVRKLEGNYPSRDQIVRMLNE